LADAVTQLVVTPVILAEQVDFQLMASGSTLIPREHYAAWPETARAYEDIYSIVGVWSFDTFDELSSSWLEAQDAVIRLVSSNVISTDSKSWDGYVVLCTPDSPGRERAALVSHIRGDTRRIRKLVLAGDDLEGVTNDLLPAVVRNAIAPVLNLHLAAASGGTDPLASLSERVGGDEKTRALIELAISAYENESPTLPEIYERIKSEL
jgi:hypothetical protein